MRSNIKTLFAFVWLLVCGFEADASWISNSFVNSQSFTNTIKVTGVPNSTPYVATNGQIVYSQPWLATATNGIMSPTWVLAGNYTVTFGPQADIVIINTPNDTNTYSLWQLITNANSFTNWPTLPGVASIQAGTNITVSSQGPVWTINAGPSGVQGVAAGTNGIQISTNGSVVTISYTNSSGANVTSGVGIATSTNGSVVTVSVTAPTLTNNESAAVTISNVLTVFGITNYGPFFATNTVNGAFVQFTTNAHFLMQDEWGTQYYTHTNAFGYLMTNGDYAYFTNGNLFLSGTIPAANLTGIMPDASLPLDAVTTNSQNQIQHYTTATYPVTVTTTGPSNNFGFNSSLTLITNGLVTSALTNSSGSIIANSVNTNTGPSAINSLITATAPLVDTQTGPTNNFSLPANLVTLNTNNGNALTNLNASNLASGTVPNAVLGNAVITNSGSPNSIDSLISATAPLVDTKTGPTNVFSLPANLVTLNTNNGNALTNVPASSIVSGGVVATAALGSGAANAGTVLDGASAWQVMTNLLAGTGLSISSGTISASGVPLSSLANIAGYSVLGNNGSAAASPVAENAILLTNTVATTNANTNTVVMGNGRIIITNWLGNSNLVLVLGSNGPWAWAISNNNVFVGGETTNGNTSWKASTNSGQVNDNGGLIVQGGEQVYGTSATYGTMTFEGVVYLDDGLIVQNYIEQIYTGGNSFDSGAFTTDGFGNLVANSLSNATWITTSNAIVTNNFYANQATITNVAAPSGAAYIGEPIVSISSGGSSSPVAFGPISDSALPVDVVTTNSLNSLQYYTSASGLVTNSGGAGPTNNFTLTTNGASANSTVYGVSNNGAGAMVFSPVSAGVNSSNITYATEYGGAGYSVTQSTNITLDCSSDDIHIPVTTNFFITNFVNARKGETLTLYLNPTNNFTVYMNTNWEGGGLWTNTSAGVISVSVGKSNTPYVISLHIGDLGPNTNTIVVGGVLPPL